MRSLLRVAALTALAGMVAPGIGQAEPVDRVVVRFVAPETGGVGQPQFVFERELALEARIEALMDEAFQATPALPYREDHLRSALERHIAESLLESLPISPRPSQAEVDERVRLAGAGLAQRVGGTTTLHEAARLEGLEPAEVFRILQRQARASLYLDRMVAPMLDPSDDELQELHDSGRSPFSREPYGQARDKLRRWVVTRRLREAVANYYEAARSRLRVKIVD